MAFRGHRRITRLGLLILFQFGVVIAFSQKEVRDIYRPIIVRTNLLSLIARQPTLSIEKVLTSTMSAELSLVQGEFREILFTDRYSYRGFLLRIKKFIEPITLSQPNGYAGLYMGNLRRNIYSHGWSDPTGWFSFPGRDFSALSIRGGATLGAAIFTKSKWHFDGQISLGYGRHVHIYWSSPDHDFKGYLDTQIWLSAGYAF